MTVYNPGAAAGGGTTAATDTIYDAKGDLVAGTGPDAAAKVSVGANGLKLKAASAAAAGVKWDCGFSGTLPASPVTGDEYFWEVDATNHVVWHMLYNGTVWVFLGGPHLSDQVLTSETTTSTTYAALATAGPSVTLPGIGTYLVDTGVEVLAPASGQRLTMSYDIGATGAVDADRVTFVDSGTNVQLNLYRRQRKAFAAASALVSKYKVSSSTGTFAGRYLGVIPVTITP